MGFFIVIEASRSDGTIYRVGVGCRLHPWLLSMVASLIRFF
jgi:hypothetical protein